MSYEQNYKIAQFIDRANVVHQSKYDYSLWTSYLGTAAAYHLKNVPVVCPAHGGFFTSIANHLRGSGCPHCGRLNANKHTRKNKEYYIAQAIKIHNDRYDYSLWVDVDNASDNKVTIICNSHGKFSQRPTDHIKKKAGCPECKIENAQATALIRYGKKHISQLNIPSDVLSLLDDKNWLIDQHTTQKKSIPVIASDLGVSASLVTSRCKDHNITVQRFRVSAWENEIASFIRSMGVDIETSNRSILNGKELDIFIPSANIAIEANGLYWHSEANGKDSSYHLNKTQTCEAKGIRLIHIFEDEWRNQNQQCKDTIKHLLNKSDKGCYARKATISEISWKQAKDYLNKYHLLGAGNSGSYRIGAFNPSGDLIGVMVFGHQNNERSDPSIVELKRFVTDKKNNPGLGSKMFKYAVTQKEYTKIIAFVDKRWFTGLVKDYIGFVLVNTTLPTLWWTNGNDRHHRRFETKKSLLKSNPEFNAGDTKLSMMSSCGFYRIWDCGKLKLEWIV